MYSRWGAYPYRNVGGGMTRSVAVAPRCWDCSPEAAAFKFEEDRCSPPREKSTHAIPAVIRRIALPARAPHSSRGRVLDEVLSLGAIAGFFFVGGLLPKFDFNWEATGGESETAFRGGLGRATPDALLDAAGLLLPGKGTLIGASHFGHLTVLPNSFSDAVTFTPQFLHWILSFILIYTGLS